MIILILSSIISGIITTIIVASILSGDTIKKLNEQIEKLNEQIEKLKEEKRNNFFCNSGDEDSNFRDFIVTENYLEKHKLIRLDSSKNEDTIIFNSSPFPKNEDIIIFGVTYPIMDEPISKGDILYTDKDSFPIIEGVYIDFGYVDIHRFHGKVTRLNEDLNPYLVEKLKKYRTK